MALAPLMVRWGPDASSDLLRRSARCTYCGAKGADLQHPSARSSHIALAFHTRAEDWCRGRCSLAAPAERCSVVNMTKRLGTGRCPQGSALRRVGFAESRSGRQRSQTCSIPTLAKTEAPTGHQTSARMPVGDRRGQELTLCVGFVRVTKHTLYRRRARAQLASPAFSAFGAALLRLRLRVEAAGRVPVRSTNRDPSPSCWGSSVLESGRSIQKYTPWARCYSRASMGDP